MLRGINARIKAGFGRKQRDAKGEAEPTVAVLHPKRGAPVEEILLPGNIQAFVEAPIYARTNGYLKQWTADIGARSEIWTTVLAEIETPEGG